MGGSTLLNGTSSVVQITNRPIYNLVNYSVSFWINATPTATDKYIIHQGKNDSATPFWGIGYYDATGSSFRLRMFIRDDANNVISGSGYLTNPLVHGRWYHVIITDHGGSMKCYVDGVSTGLTPSYTRATITLNQTAFGAVWRTTVANYFGGKLAVVKIFNSALTADQALELYISGSVKNVSPVANYALDDQPSTYIDSIAGNNGTGTATTYSTDTPVQQRVVVSDDKASLKFNGSSAKIDSNFVGITGSMTFVGKLKRIVNTGNHAIFGGSLANNIIIRCVSGTNTLQFYAKSSTTSITFANAIPLNKWFRFALSYDGATAKLYINGQLFGSIAYTETWNPSPNTLVIGSRDGTDFFNGNIESIQIFNRILTLEEIKNIHFNNILPTSGIALNLPLNEGSGTTAYDSSGNGNNGTITGATWVTGGPIKLRSAASNRIPIAVPRTSV